MKRLKMIAWDMDGTIADFYKVENWLNYLEAEDPTPYATAEPIWHMEIINELLKKLQTLGVEQTIITWLSKNSSEDFKKKTREAKKEWLEKNEFPFDYFHAVQYGTTKADTIRKYINYEEDEIILIDDNTKIRGGWTLGETVDPTTINIEDYLQKLLEKIS